MVPEAKLIEVFWELGLFADLSSQDKLLREVVMKIKARFPELNESECASLALDMRERLLRLKDRQGKDRLVYPSQENLERFR